MDETTPSIPRLDRPLDQPMRLLLTPKRVRARFEGTWIADSRKTALLLGYQTTPLYSFPDEDVRTDALEPARTEKDPRLGPIRWYDVRVKDREIEEAAWSVEEPSADVPGLADRVFVVWDAADAWYEEDEEVFVHPRDPTKRIDVLESSRHVAVEVAGRTLAESQRPRLLIEPGLPVRYYLPKTDVRMDLLEPSPTVTRCPYKGRAEHYSLASDDEGREDVAWCYHHPNPEVVKIQGLVCLYNERVDRFVVDGVEQPLPDTQFG